MKIRRGNNQALDLTGWGNAERSTYPAGEYTIEIWYNYERLILERINIYD
jgi:hypothetical protein